MMRRTLALTLALVASLGVTGTATAVSIGPLLPTLQATVGGSVSPEKLPAHEYVPVTWSIFGEVSTADGTHPSALREMVLDVDKDVKINVEGFPACRPGAHYDTRSATKVCDDTIVGKGLAHIEIAFPEQKPIIVSSPLKVFNGGEKGGEITLLIHAFITVPAPTAIVTTVTIQKKGTGLHTISKIPVIAGGMGSLIDFNFHIGKIYLYKGSRVGYLEARCPDGVFQLNVAKLLFKNEAGVPQVAPSTVMKGTVGAHCTPKG